MRRIQKYRGARGGVLDKRFRSINRFLYPANASRIVHGTLLYIGQFEMPRIFGQVWSIGACAHLESDSLPLEATSLWRGSEATQRSAVVHRGCEDADTSMGPRAPLPGSSPLMKATVNLHRSPHSMLARCHRSIAEMRLRGEKEAPGSFSDVSLRP